MGKYEGVKLLRTNPPEHEMHYSEITHDGEPWFLIRAQDTFAVPAVKAYAGLLRAACRALALAGKSKEADHLRRGADEVANLADRIDRWQWDNPELVKVPD